MTNITIKNYTRARLKRWYNEECKHNISDVIV